MNHSELVERYLQGAEVMSRAVRDVSPAILDKVPGPNKWSIRQYLVHVCDVELVNSIRIRQMTTNSGTQLLGLDQELWASELHYEKQPVQEILAALRAVQKLNANLLRAIAPAVWEHKGVHPKRGEMTLAVLVERATMHCENHAKKIEELRQQFGAAVSA